MTSMRIRWNRVSHSSRAPFRHQRRASVSVWARVQTLDNYTFGSMGPKRDGSVTIDLNGTLGTCVRALHDVWDVQSGYIMQPDYFAHVPGTEAPVHFLRAFFLPQCALYLKALPMFAHPPPIPEEILQGRACYSTHYYDGLTLVTRHWN
ncbi:uncharacterized protein EDB91DRAFT_1172789 [Suillus paluster]|uniref:uncharacterized protein n=1 Tax=Suillus paluster TaxID=48578 RepID=UPI001B866AE8|nr:uncharacterized protein EDB91DRAFT_1172789 [Suillus paluster]KAG1723486.1 hypothetical protein EDB91DRAFT_1172789 [Suillus paluster]